MMSAKENIALKYQNGGEKCEIQFSSYFLQRYVKLLDVFSAFCLLIF